MWARPNNIPGETNRTVPLPGDKICPNCNKRYRKIEVSIKNDKPTPHCPHCKKKVPVRIPRSQKK